MGNMSEGISSEGRRKIENHQILNIINLFNLKMGPCRISGLIRGILKIKFIVPTFLVLFIPLYGKVKTSLVTYMHNIYAFI